MFLFYSILIGNRELIKISDFGTSRQWNEISTKMSFAGTVAWMAPEIIKNEPCNEKVDIWSYGVVLWEMIHCEVPYKGVDSSAIIWGVGNNTLSLPIPKECPDGFRLLMKLCWNIKPRNRPSFKVICHHLEVAGNELLEKINHDDKIFSKLRHRWREDVSAKITNMKRTSTTIHSYEKNLIKQRENELRYAQEIRLIYETRLAMTNQLLTELKAKEKEFKQKENGFYTQRIHNTLNFNENQRQKSLSYPQVRIFSDSFNHNMNMLTSLSNGEIESLSNFDSKDLTNRNCDETFDIEQEKQGSSNYVLMSNKFSKNQKCNLQNKTQVDYNYPLFTFEDTKYSNNKG